MLKNFKIIITYNDNKFIETKSSYENNDLILTITNRNNIYKAQISVKTEIILNSVKLIGSYNYKLDDKIFINGYQSWTDSKELTISDKMKPISFLAKPILNKFKFDRYGDYTFKSYANKKGVLHGYTYGYIKNKNIYNLIGSLSEKEGFTIIETNTLKNKLIINKECEDIKINSSYTLFNLVYITDTEKNVFDFYFNKMSIKPPTIKPMSGFTTWYNYYENVNEKIILDNIESLKEIDTTLDIFQIDDGYQTYVGDWLDIDKNKFPNGLKAIVNTIKENNLKAGLWLAPFVCETKSNIFKHKKSWLLKDKSNNLVPAGSNWSGFYVLDLENNEVKKYLKDVFNTILNIWNFDMVKLDFLYAACIIPSNNKTRGQKMTEAMDFLREVTKDKILLACGVPLGPSFGKVDFMRIGCDIGLDWNDKFYMRNLHRERISTYNAINNTISRRHLNGRAFLNDPDVFLLRDSNIKLNNFQKQTIAYINGLFGSLIFTSDNIKEYTESKKELFNKIINLKDILIDEIIWINKDFLLVKYEDYKFYMNISNKKVVYKNMPLLGFETKIFKKLEGSWIEQN